MLVMGKSGAGKSTFINNCANLAEGRKFKDDRLFAIPATFADANGNDKRQDCNIPRFKHFVGNEAVAVGESVTKSVNFYDLKYNGFQFTLIDTPGLGDTGGVRQDRANLNSIIDAINPITQIQAIVWVCKSSENRLSQELKYCVEQFRDLMPKSHQSNIFLIFTHVGNQRNFNAKLIMEELRMPSNNCFTFENSCIMPLDILRSFTDHNGEDNDLEQEIKLMEKLWQKNESSFSQMIEAFRTILPINSEDIQVLHFKKRILEKLLFIYADEIDNYEHLIKEDKLDKSLEEEQPNSFDSQSLKEESHSFFTKAWRGIKWFFAAIGGIFSSSQPENTHAPLKNSEDQKLIDEKHSDEKNESLKTRLGHLRASISYLERHINKVSQVDFFKNLETSKMIENEIFYTEKSKQLSEAERRKKLDGLYKIKSEFDKTKKALVTTDEKESSEMFTVLIEFLSEIIKQEEKINGSRNSRINELLQEMSKKAELAQHRAFQQASSQFDIEFGHFIKEAYVTKKVKTR